VSTEVVELLRYTVFAIVIALVVALGTLKAAGIGATDDRRRRDDRPRSASPARPKPSRRDVSS
jgi:hypothetical protein